MGHAGWKDIDDAAPPDRTPILASIGCAHPAYAICISGQCFACMGAGRWNRVKVKKWRELPSPPVVEVLDYDI